MQEQSSKLEKLKDCIRSLGSLAVGFSGGVDSSLLLFAAHEVLGDSVIAITAAAASVPKREISEAKGFCEKYGIRHIICEIDQFEEAEFRHNGPDRCYHCKRLIFSRIMKIAAENGVRYIAEGSNLDDMGDYRPGLRAVEELAVKSPLREAGLSKDDIRMISKELGLPTWNKPAYACLASRFVYGEEITKEKLQLIDNAEQYLIERGFIEERVRMHGDIARIEVPAKDIPRLAGDETREAVYEYFRQLGFRFVTLDMGGYRSGSMNATLKRD